MSAGFCFVNWLDASFFALLASRRFPSRNAQSMSTTTAQFLAEVMGTMILVLLGDGVVANVLLNKSKGQNSGWIVITAGWAFAVTIGVYTVNSISDAHLNPAVTIAMACIGKFAWAGVPIYIAAQM